MNKMDISTDIYHQLEKTLAPTVTENQETDGIIKSTVSDAVTINATKQTSSERKSDISASKVMDSLPKVLYLKKLVHPALNQKATSPVSSVKEPIPKLIVSTKSIKLASQLITPDGVRYITTARKPTTVENSDPLSVKQDDAIKSTKIIIKGITSQDKRLVVCESPTTTEPLVSPQSSPTMQSPKRIIDSSIKNDSKEMPKDEPSMEINERVSTTEREISVPDANEENRPTSNSITPRTNRETKQSRKTLPEVTKRIKRKLNETDEGEGTAATSSLDTSQENDERSRSSSVTKESNNQGGSISIRRNTRSLNAEFSAKQRKFLAGIQKHSRDSDEEHSDDERGRGRRKIRKSGKLFPPLEPGYDKFCWQCHQSDPQIACTHCKRTYHVECLKTKQLPKTDHQKLIWECPECEALETSIKDTEKARYDNNQLCTMLEFALQRLKLTSRSLVPCGIPRDSDNIIHFVNFTSMEQKIKTKQYQSTHSFLTDCRWILHNCTIYYSRNVKLLAIAKAVFKICKQEMYDIDTCYECYYNANSCKTDWFVEICSRPHILVWAKLKGFPYWPAKAMTTNSQGMVDVRFFGDHDRAFVPIRECYLYSKDHPNPITVKSKRQSIAHSVVEVDKYIKKLTAKFGSFIFPESKTFFDPFKEEEQLEQMIPNYRNYANALTNKKSTSNSDLTYKIVKTADNNLSIFKKNDPSSSPLESVAEKAQHVEPKHGKNPTIDASDDLKYQVMRRDKETSRMDGRVDSVILKRKAGSPSPVEVVSENRKKMRLLANYRRMSTPTMGKESPLNVDSTKNVEQIDSDRQTTIPKAMDDERSKTEIGRQSSSKSSETPTKDVVTKSNSKEDLISAVVKKLDKLQEFVSTIDNCKGKIHDSVIQSRSNKKTDNCNESGSSIDDVDQPMTVIPQRIESNSLNRVVDTNLDKSKSDEDDNLLVPMHDRSIHETSESKKDLQLSAITSSRQGSMSGSSIQSVTGSLDDPYEMSIKTEPLSGDEMDKSVTNDNSPERIMSPFDNRSQNGSQENSFSKISVKNINSMTKPLDQTLRNQGAIQKVTLNKSVLRPDLVRQRNKKMLHLMRKNVQSNVTSSITSNIQQYQQQQQNSQLKQSQNMVCIPMDRSNFQRIESMFGNVRGTTSAHVKSNPPPLTAVSTTPTITVVSKDLISQPKTNLIPAVSTTISSVGPPPLSLTTPLAITENSMNNSLILQSNTSDNFASVITDMMKHNEPKLTPKPIGPLRFDGSQLTSEAGHYSKMLIDNSHKFADFFRSVFEVTLADIAGMGCSEAKIQLLELELEQSKMAHAKELADLKSSTGMILKEMKKNFETEKTKLINETRRQCELDRIRAVEDTKKRQWCANCGKEAKFYCCWNTSYCDYPCQQQHWPRHMSHCSQTDDISGGKTTSYGVKAKELTQLQSLSLRHATTAKKSTSARTNPQNQQLERLNQLQLAKSNSIQKPQPLPAAQYKIINRLNPGIMQTSAYLSNANINLNAVGNVNLQTD